MPKSLITTGPIDMAKLKLDRYKTYRMQLASDLLMGVMEPDKILRHGDRIMVLDWQPITHGVRVKFLSLTSLYLSEMIFAWSELLSL